MKHIKLIGIHGKAQSGKDTVARFIKRQTGGYIYSLTTPIREMLKCIGIDFDNRDWIERHKEDVIPAIGKSPRQLLQTLGTEWGRDLINPNLWIMLATHELEDMGQGMIVPDVRFDNEAATVRAEPFGAKIWAITRPGCSVPAGAHVSETTGQRFTPDAVIDNSGDILHLRQQVLNRWWALDAGLTNVNAEITA